MRCKRHFRKNITENFSETPAFHNKSTWNPPQAHPALEMHLSQMEAIVFFFFFLVILLDTISRRRNG